MTEGVLPRGSRPAREIPHFDFLIPIFPPLTDAFLWRTIRYDRLGKAYPSVLFFDKVPVYL